MSKLLALSIWPESQGAEEGGLTPHAFETEMGIQRQTWAGSGKAGCGKSAAQVRCLTERAGTMQGMAVQGNVGEDRGRQAGARHMTPRNISRQS